MLIFELNYEGASDLGDLFATVEGAKAAHEADVVAERRWDPEFWAPECVWMSAGRQVGGADVLLCGAHSRYVTPHEVAQ